MKNFKRVAPLLNCPACKSKLNIQIHLTCVDCHRTYPIVDGVPILINEDKSIFRIEEIIKASKMSYHGLSHQMTTSLKKMVPNISENWVEEKNLCRLSKLMRQNIDCPLVLILGCGAKGKRLDALLHDESIDLVASDVYQGDGIDLVCDAHDIPFQDVCFDGVLIQAVLEHVVDPWRCVSEIYRVLKPNGLVYAETPFMQQVHMRCYDFTRFTHLGHRRLFKRFSEIDSGMSGGPGMALAWAYQHFLTSFFRNKRLRKFARVFAGFTSFWLKYFDKFCFNDSPQAMDAALGFYFLGCKTNSILNDCDLLKLYEGIL